MNKRLSLCVLERRTLQKSTAKIHVLAPNALLLDLLANRRQHDAACDLQWKKPLPIKIIKTWVAVCCLAFFQKTKQLLANASLEGMQCSDLHKLGAVLFWNQIIADKNEGTL